MAEYWLNPEKARQHLKEVFISLLQDVGEEAPWPSREEIEPQAEARVKNLFGLKNLINDLSSRWDQLRPDEERLFWAIRHYLYHFDEIR